MVWLFAPICVQFLQQFDYIKMSDYACSEKRNKGKDKRKEKKKHPYRKGGKLRGLEIKA